MDFVGKVVGLSQDYLTGEYEGVLEALKIWSVLTKDMDHCYITGSNIVHIHHVFNGSRKKASEKRGFLIPLHPDLHTNGPDSVHMKPNQGLDLRLKQDCQRYYEIHYGSRENFIKEFGKSYL